MNGSSSELLVRGNVVLATESRSGVGRDQAEPCVQRDDPALQLCRAARMETCQGSRVRSTEESPMEAGRRLGGGFPWTLSRDPFESDDGEEMGDKGASGGRPI